jgi:hypothetical protein
MRKPFSRPVITTIASAGAILTASLVGGAAVFLSGVLQVSAEPQITVAIHQAHAKGDRLPRFVKGAACSSRGWPHYEPGCQFDMRRPADEMRTIRVIALR